MSTARELILELLHTPYTITEIADKLQINRATVKSEVWKLYNLEEIHPVKITNPMTRAYAYQRVYTKVYGVCKSCDAVVEKILLVDRECTNCKKLDEYDIPFTEPSEFLVDYMQSIINKQKQQIYALSAQNYILKKKLNDTLL